MKNKTQKEVVLEHLIKYGNISTIECYSRYKITDLAHAIMLLRKDGYKIPDKWEKPKYSMGYAKKYKRYFLGDIDGRNMETY